MGPCQGGFCLSRIAGVIARELRISGTDITKKGQASKYLLGNEK
jgi:hypothetical protein